MTFNAESSCPKWAYNANPAVESERPDKNRLSPNADYADTLDGYRGVLVTSDSVRHPTAAEAAAAWCQIDDRLGNPSKDDPISEALHVLSEFIEASPNGSSGAPR